MKQMIAFNKFSRNSLSSVVPLLAMLVMVLLFASPSCIQAQRAVNVGIDFPEDPGECPEDGYNDPPAQIRIITLGNKLTYKCSFNVTISLYSNPRAIPNTLTPALVGKTQYTSETGTVTLSETGVDTPGWGFQYRYQVSASVEGTTISWDRYSAAFIVAANLSDTTTTSTPVPPTPSPADVLQPVVSFPRDANNCQPFGGQPNIKLMNLTSGGLARGTDFTVNTTLIAPTSPSSGDLLVAELTGNKQLSAQAGTGDYTDLGVCGNPGIGYHLQHEISYMEKTVTMIGAAFTVHGTDQPSATTTAATPPGQTTTTAPPTPTPTPTSCDISMARVLFTRQPGGGYAGSVLQVQPIIQIIDTRTGLLLDCAGTATAELVWPSYFGTTWGATLQGTTTVNTETGVFTFTNLAISKIGYGYNLKVTVNSNDKTFTVYSTVIYIGSAANNVYEGEKEAPSEGGTEQGNADDADNKSDDATTSSSLDTTKLLIIVIGVVAVVAMIIPIVVFALTRSHFNKRITALEEQQIGGRGGGDHHSQQKYSSIPLGDSSGSVILPSLEESVEEGAGTGKTPLTSFRKKETTTNMPGGSRRSNPVLNFSNLYADDEAPRAVELEEVDSDEHRHQSSAEPTA